ncbi:signal transduction histidine kinase [Variovorax boronicumulans]|uniref:ATP-binding protein n=1 Tax=Variovorax boronicumulans TaxID=436515 RepID=UPI00247455B7|nr:ATP-binding protein [Variovorax boronicumulans]MDH6170767.1 signal transduction histidine kinase [Variovorax boronicumulans]
MTNSPLKSIGTRHAEAACEELSRDPGPTEPIRRSRAIALTAVRALAIATLGQNTHASMLVPMPCTINDGLLWLLSVSMLVGFTLVTAFLGLKFQAHRVGAGRLASALERVSGDARMPALDETGSGDIGRLARAINTVRRRQAEREAEHLDVQAAYAHDLRTPLTRMGLRCELLEDSAARTAMERDLMEMRELVEGSIACARMQHSMNEPLQRVDADGLIGNLVRNYRDSGRAIALDGCIGQPVVACPLALRRVLANLIDNALRYGTDVRVCARVDTKCLVLAVVDSGPGIKPTQIDAVLSPWIQAQQSHEEKPGSGLGLAIARRLAQSMQGELHLENRLSGGFEARLTLPLVVA